MKHIIDELAKNHNLSDEDLKHLLENYQEDDLNYLAKKASEAKQPFYQNKVYLRGLIEFTSYCKNNCYYCGIRCGNQNAERYRLTKDEILECCHTGYRLGYRTFVLQGGEDPFYTDDDYVDLIQSIKSYYPDCAITLSIGERERESFEKYYAAGADRYLLRHETANEDHYKMLHPKSMSLAHRKQCLFDLKEIGYQVGCGFMVGSPGQTTEHLIEDLRFIQDLKPHMVGIGPFISHHDTPFKNKENGTLNLTLVLISILRLLQPNLLLPATTALGTISKRGRELGILSGGNVVMPNLSPTTVRKKYLLYDNKICTGDEAAECRQCLERRINSIDHIIVEDRGDFKKTND